MQDALDEATDSWGVKVSFDNKCVEVSNQTMFAQLSSVAFLLVNLTESKSAIYVWQQNIP